MQYTIRTRLLATTIAALAVIVTPALLFAHARLVRSSPADKAHVGIAPLALTLWFSERPELKFTSLQLLDSTGAAAPLASVSALPGDGLAITAAIERPLANGKYTVVWRTAAADGHASNGKYTFVVDVAAVPSSAAPAIVPQPPASPGPQPGSKSNTIFQSAPTPSYSSAIRWAELVAVLLLVGTVAFRLVVIPEAKLTAAVAGEAADRARRFATGALLLFVATTLTRVVVQSDLVPGAANARIPAVMTVIESTRWGHGWMIGACGAVIALLGVLIARASLAGWIVALVGAAAIAASEGATGHSGASTQHLPVAIAVDLAHFLGAGGWLGGLAMVLFAGLPATHSLDDAERTRAGSRLLRSYHRSAVECVTLVVVTAVIAAWLRLGALDALWTTPYGLMLLRKIILVLGLLGFGWYHQRTVIRPEWGPATTLRFQRSAVAELLLGAIVVAVTALLIGTTLPPQ